MRGIGGSPPVTRATAPCACRFIVSSTDARPVRCGPWPLNSGNRCEIQPRNDLRGQLAAGQNAKLRLVVRFGVRHVFVVRRRIESRDRRGAFVLDEHARRRTEHRRRRERADGDGEQHEQENRDDDVSIFIDGVEAIEEVRIRIGREQAFPHGTLRALRRRGIGGSLVLGHRLIVIIGNLSLVLQKTTQDVI